MVLYFRQGLQESSQLKIDLSAQGERIVTRVRPQSIRRSNCIDRLVGARGNITGERYIARTMVTSTQNGVV